MTTGRPTDFTLPIATTICLRISDGQSLRKICSDPDMPAKSTVFRWLRDHESFRDQYRVAREEQAEILAEEIIEIADENPGISGQFGGVDGAAVQHQRLRVDARKWVASKLKPRTYGDKVQTEHSGSVSMSLEQILARANQIQAEKSPA